MLPLYLFAVLPSSFDSANWVVVVSCGATVHVGSLGIQGKWRKEHVWQGPVYKHGWWIRQNRGITASVFEGLPQELRKLDLQTCWIWNSSFFRVIAPFATFVSIHGIWDVRLWWSWRQWLLSWACTCHIGALGRDSGSWCSHLDRVFYDWFRCWGFWHGLRLSPANSGWINQ